MSCCSTKHLTKVLRCHTHSLSATFPTKNFSFRQKLNPDLKSVFKPKLRLSSVLAEFSQLNLPHGTKLKSGKEKKLTSKKRICSEVSVQSGESVESVDSHKQWHTYPVGLHHVGTSVRCPLINKTSVTSASLYSR